MVYLVHVQGQERELLAGDDHHRVGPGDGGGEERDEGEEGVLVGACDSHDPDGLVDLDHGAVELRLLDGASILVGIGCPMEQALDLTKND